MNWWISIVFYLWHNTLRRWWEQPLNVLSKLSIACLVGSLGAIMILASSFLGDEMKARMLNREALTATISEAILAETTGSSIGIDDPEEEGWRSLAAESIVVYQIASRVEVNGDNDVLLCAMHQPEDYGYPDGLLFLTDDYPEDFPVMVGLSDIEMRAYTAAPSPLLKRALRKRSIVLGSVERLAPLLERGFTKVVVLRAADLGRLEKIHSVVETIAAVEGRRIYIQSALGVLKQIEQVQKIQVYVLWASTIGAGLVLGLVSGALAWMEFREERYLMSLIRSFGVGSLTLLVHAVIENCLLSVCGVLLSFLLLWGLSENLELTALQMQWLKSIDPLFEAPGQILLLGALFGGLLSCIPIGIGLRKPLGLVLK